MKSAHPKTRHRGVSCAPLCPCSLISPHPCLVLVLLSLISPDLTNGVHAIALNCEANRHMAI